MAPGAGSDRSCALKWTSPGKPCPPSPWSGPTAGHTCPLSQVRRRIGDWLEQRLGAEALLTLCCTMKMDFLLSMLRLLSQPRMERCVELRCRSCQIGVGSCLNVLR